MDTIIVLMDHFITHLAPLMRWFPSRTPVRTIGHDPHKTSWVDMTFDTFNFSLILKGCGYYHSSGGIWRVEAPCVITQWPGIPVRYGPDEEWTELFFMYMPENLPIFRNMGLADSSRPAWNMASDCPALGRVDELMALAKDAEKPGRTDEIDRLCELVVVESLLSLTPPSGDRHMQAIEAIRMMVHRDFRKRIDFDKLAAAHHMSPATFRRHWQRVVGCPPGQYACSLRIQHTCRLLAETDLPIGEIALQAGFEDALYFSRRFAQTMQMTATEYRRLNQIRNM